MAALPLGVVVPLLVALPLPLSVGVLLVVSVVALPLPLVGGVPLLLLAAVVVEVAVVAALVAPLLLLLLLLALPLLLGPLLVPLLVALKRRWRRQAAVALRPLPCIVATHERQPRAWGSYRPQQPPRHQPRPLPAGSRLTTCPLAAPAPRSPRPACSLPFCQPSSSGPAALERAPPPPPSVVPRRQARPPAQPLPSPPPTPVGW